MAFDFDVKGLDADVVRELIIQHENDLLLIKIQRMESKVSWIHIDIAPVPSGKKRIYLFNV